MRILVLSVLLVTSAVSPSFSNEPGVIELPETLKITYGDLVAAMRSGDLATIRQYCLPFSIEITEQQREKPEHGIDINILFVKKSFDETIVSVRKESEDCYLIRTNTTALSFIETKSTGWKLYRYLDKPIE